MQESQCQCVTNMVGCSDCMVQATQQAPSTYTRAHSLHTQTLAKFLHCTILVTLSTNPKIMLLVCKATLCYMPPLL